MLSGSAFKMLVARILTRLSGGGSTSRYFQQRDRFTAMAASRQSLHPWCNKSLFSACALLWPGQPIRGSTICIVAHVRAVRRLGTSRPTGPPLPTGFSSPGIQGRPRRVSMWVRIMRRRTCEGVRSSSAHRRSNTAFFCGSIRIVRRAVRCSIGTTAELSVYMRTTLYDNETIIRVESSRKYPRRDLSVVFRANSDRSRRIASAAP